MYLHGTFKEWLGIVCSYPFWTIIEATIYDLGCESLGYQVFDSANAMHFTNILLFVCVHTISKPYISIF